MRLPLKQHWANYLCKLPESGMGYQRVDIRLKDGSEVEELEWPSTRPTISSDDIAKIQLSRDREWGSRIDLLPINWPI